MLEIIPVDRPLTPVRRISAFTRRFWHDLRDGRSPAARCDERLPQVHLSAKALLPALLVAPGGLGGAAGRGRLYTAASASAAPAAFRGEAPYRVGIVDLRGGPAPRHPALGRRSRAAGQHMRIVALRTRTAPLFAARPEGATGAATAA